MPDPHTLYRQNGRGNNCIDSLKNIRTMTGVALIFFIPGCETIRDGAQNLCGCRNAGTVYLCSGSTQARD